MWIGIIVIIGGGLYLAWCLSKGKIFLTTGTDHNKKTRLIDRKDKPTTFWITWVASAVALIIFAVYLLRTGLGY